MLPRLTSYGRLGRWIAACAVLCLSLTGGNALAEEPPPAPLPPSRLTLPEAVTFALQYNPELAAFRQQRGIAAAQVVIAETYPFNPVLENRVQQSSGPASGTITNQVPVEEILLWEVELRSQRTYRRQGASAVLSKTDWQIAHQEQTVAVNVMRAFTTLLYRRQKLGLAEEALRFNEQLVNDLRKLMTGGQLTAADLVLGRSEVANNRDLVGAAQESFVAARHDLARAIGVLEVAFQPQGSLELPAAVQDVGALEELALVRRADFRATQAAVDEARANLRLAVANRYGNPSLGPIFTYDPTRISSIGLQFNFPLPIINTHRGEIMQREAELSLALANLRQSEFLIRQDVDSAVARLKAAHERAEAYRTDLLPELRKGVEQMEKLFTAAVSGVDVLRVVDVRRKLLAARDSYLDTLWRAAEARVDLVAAIGVEAPPASSPPKPDLTPP